MRGSATRPSRSGNRRSSGIACRVLEIVGKAGHAGELVPRRRVKRGGAAGVDRAAAGIGELHRVVVADGSIA